MAHLDDIKQRLLREAVQENMETRQGTVLPSLQGGHRTPRLWLRDLLLVVMPVILFTLSYLFSLIPADRRELAYLASLVFKTVRTGPPSLAAYQAHDPKSTFAAPDSIDLTVFPLAIRKIVLDPGHGGDDAGAVTPLGMTEKEITLDISQRLRFLLAMEAFEVSMTREKDETVSLTQRTAFANAREADLFVSIHVNWFDTPATRGVETYYIGATDDPHTLRLAALENRSSGYSLGDFRRLLEGVYLDLRRTESRQLARVIQQKLVKTLRRVNPSLVNRGVRRAPFLVLVDTKMPAVLAEVSYLSNQEEARLLATPKYRQRIAQALLQGIRAYADVLNSPSRKEAGS